MNVEKKKLNIFLIILIVAFAFGCSNSDSSSSGSSDGYAFTYDDAITAFNAFIDAFFESRGVFSRDTDQSGSMAVAWTQATMFDMIQNAYKISGDSQYLDLLEKHYEGCKGSFTFEWYDYNAWDLYDDMMWWVGSLARAYQLTGMEEYLTVSQEGFDRVWYGKDSDFDGSGWDELDALGSYGGDDPSTYTSSYTPDCVAAMYWDWKYGRTGKMSCVHFPTMIAAIELYHCTGDSDYLSKAKELYSYGATKLFNSSTGAVADSVHDEGSSADWSTLVYNQATAMGAFAMLYLETGIQEYLDNAVAAMQYIVDNKSTANGILKPEGTTTQSEVTNEQGIYNAILATYIPVIIDDCGQTQFTEFIESSIEYGWGNRDSRNLCNKFLEKKLTSTAAVSSYTASGVPALMLTFPGIEDRK